MPGPIVPSSRSLSPRPRRLLGFLGLLLGTLLLLQSLPASGASPRATRGRNGMVVSPEAHATEAGLEVLREGGNAVDAAITVAFCLTATYPVAAPLGGGGFLLYRSPEGEHHALDFREVAPGSIDPDVFLDEDGRPIPGLSLDGGLAIGVPGGTAGLAEAHERWGTRPWPDLTRPAIRLARRGFPVSAWLAAALDARGGPLLENPAAREIFSRDGRMLVEGEILVQKDLAKTLKKIARRGADAFYDGPIAESLIATVQRYGGVMRREDLTGYTASIREPVYGNYRGYRVVSFPPPSSGGVALLQILGMLEPFDLADAGPGASLTAHLTAEASRRAFADRSRWLGDSDFADVPVSGLLDAAYLREREPAILPTGATPSASVHPGSPPGSDAHETLHVSVADSRGGAVAMTLTLNRWFGTGIVADGTGILLNNEMDDFALAPGVPNLYGLLGGEANAVRGNKRPLSSMTPTIVEHAEPGRRPALVLGSPGGSTIITSVLQVLMNVIDHGMPLQEAVDAPRFHHQWQPDRIRHEPRAFPRDVIANLEALGHALEVTPSSLGNVNAIGSAEDGTWLGAADPRRDGAAAGY